MYRPYGNSCYYPEWLY